MDTALMVDASSVQYSDRNPAPEMAPDAANDSDRRQHARAVKVMRVARLKNVELHAECLGLVRDVSSGGMKIDADFPLEIGQSVEIALLDDQELKGDVVWLDGKTVGIRFSRPISVEQILTRPSNKHGARQVRLPRFKVEREVTLKVDDHLTDAKLLDLSQRGAKLSCDAKVKLHQNILVRLNILHAVRATVKWRAANMLGVEFHRLLTVEELSEWLRVRAT